MSTDNVKKGYEIHNDSIISSNWIFVKLRCSIFLAILASSNVDSRLVLHASHSGCLGSISFTRKVDTSVMSEPHKALMYFIFLAVNDLQSSFTRFIINLTSELGDQVSFWTKFPYLDRICLLKLSLSRQRKFSTMFV